jgi:transposase InsO family protein
MTRLGKSTLLRSALALVLIAIGSLASGPIAAHAATPSSTFPLADPNTVLAKDGTYVTYGTNVGSGAGPRCGAPTGVKLYVPFLNHGSGDTVGMSNCAAVDALPSGPGPWADELDENKLKEVWAPGVVEFNGTYFMYYTATKKGTSQKCIGLATSGGAKSPFTDRGEWACPGGGRWAIDADPFVADGKLYVVYRDDAINEFPETGISVVQVGSNGFALWDTRRDLMKSTDLAWETTNMSGTTHVIENPSIFVGGAGHRVVGHRRSQISTHRDGKHYRPTGFEYVHVMVDDHSRLAYAEMLDALSAKAAIGFLHRALVWFAERGVRVERVMTDNGAAYVSHAHRQALRELGIRHLTTRAYRPRTNGKAERFIQTLLNEWAYARLYGSSPERARQLQPWLERYNYRRPHGSLGHQPPATRINNLVRNYT